MQIGFIGLGRLGLPVCVCLAQKHTVVGYDLNPDLRKFRQYEHKEKGPDGSGEFQQHFKNVAGAWVKKDGEATLIFAGAVKEAVLGADIIFVAVQTPHEPRYEGITRLPSERADFDYKHLIQAVKDVCEHTTPDQVVVIISTVLPGTTRREILPVVANRARIVYSPLFIAMGTVMYDFLNPEFVLLGGDDKKAVKKVHVFYKTIYDYYDSPMHPEKECMVPVLEMSIESAELSKVAYNAAISTKIVLANTLMEICHKVPGCDVDDVVGVLKAANRRIVSTAYMDAGMGDGGGCHPRDGIAMSWLAEELGLSYDLFGQMMRAREEQAEWLSAMVEGYHRKINLPIVILGKAYKPESNLTTGSPALLVAELLRERGVEFTHWDPYVDAPNCLVGRGPAVVLIATKHQQFRKYPFLPGSVVLDPFRYIPQQDGVTVIPIGIGPSTKENS